MFLSIKAPTFSECFYIPLHPDQIRVTDPFPYVTVKNYL